ncbi:MAG: hypothetical protein M3Y17_07755 [Actinomycetota bacterium]|nr:hypothetical protein [Actinomycetota bacterium]
MVTGSEVEVGVHIDVEGAVGLYFSHTLKIGDAYVLAHEIRRGLDRTHAD